MEAPVPQVPMQKTLYSREYQQMLRLLHSRRTSIQVSQTELARRLNWSQVDISKCETGIRRLDVIELKLWVEALGGSLVEFIEELYDRAPKQPLTQTSNEG